tara:strand:+ start:201 stop:842 length:642 start_codon:yes stop_codon:yes gene_type:complete
MNLYRFDTNVFDFSSLFSDLSNLELLHNRCDFNYPKKFIRETDQSTHYHQILYNIARTKEFEKMYKKFLWSEVKPIFGGSIVYQKIPTFRIQFPNNISVGEFHRDRDYRDSEWHSKVKEYNFFLPFTRAFNTATIWSESCDGLGDFSPMGCKYGEFYKWDGTNLMHGNKENTETYTRVSMDFRVMSSSNYIASEVESINTKIKFKIGYYYDYM